MPRPFAALVILAALAPAGCGYFGSPGDARKPDPWLPEREFRVRSDGPSTAEQDAVVRVLDATQQQFRAGFEELPPAAQPSAVVRAVAAYADQLAATNLTGCPRDFRAALARHTEAWRHLKTTLGHFPDAYPGTTFMDDLGHLFRGDATRGRDLGGDVIAAVRRVQATRDRLAAVAKAYGVVAGEN